MSGRGGIYDGPDGQQLHGDGKPVGQPVSEPHGPYFRNQQQQPCGCYYPDVARCPESGAIYCRTHGWVQGQGQEHEKHTEEWRQEERARLREIQ